MFGGSQQPDSEAVVRVAGMIRAELRPYQRQGISWLAFLRRCGLHGVLADDMGLGKTLQATAIIAGAPSSRTLHLLLWGSSPCGHRLNAHLIAACYWHWLNGSGHCITELHLNDA